MEWARSQSERTTPNLCCRGWFDEKLRYWSVCVGLRYTLNLRLPISSLVTSTSSIGRLPSDSFSIVNLIAGCWLLMWSVNSSIKFLMHSSTFNFWPLITLWGHFQAPNFKMLNDVIVASACSYARTCQRVRNSKKIATIRDFRVYIRVNSTKRDFANITFT